MRTRTEAYITGDRTHYYKILFLIFYVIILYRPTSFVRLLLCLAVIGLLWLLSGTRINNMN
jgi:hypothetical protein